MFFLDVNILFFLKIKLIYFIIFGCFFKRGLLLGFFCLLLCCLVGGLCIILGIFFRIVINFCIIVIFMEKMIFLYNLFLNVKGYYFFCECDGNLCY